MFSCGIYCFVRLTFPISALLFMPASLQILTHEFWIFISLCHALLEESRLSPLTLLKMWAHSSKVFSVLETLWGPRWRHIDFPASEANTATYKHFTINVLPRVKDVGEQLSVHILRRRLWDYSHDISSLLDVISLEWQERHKLTMP